MVESSQDDLRRGREEEVRKVSRRRGRKRGEGRRANAQRGRRMREEETRGREEGRGKRRKRGGGGKTEKARIKKTLTNLFPSSLALQQESLSGPKKLITSS